ncbi:hypothetical protein HMI55_002107 [Coelomomyces lativittatus]|nr:hypothetical protein HMI55_002107 [Coelomomyces lativittatus]
MEIPPFSPHPNHPTPSSPLNSWATLTTKCDVVHSALYAPHYEKYIHFLAVWAALLGFGVCQTIYLRIAPQQFLISLFTTSLSFWLSYVWMSVFHLSQYYEIMAFLVSFCVGLVSHLYSRCTHQISVAPLLSGLIMMVPGGLGVLSSLQWFVQQPSSSTLLVQTLFIAMAIAFGTLASHVIPPFESALKTSPPSAKISQLRRHLFSFSSTKPTRMPPTSNDHGHDHGKSPEQSTKARPLSAAFQRGWKGFSSCFHGRSSSPSSSSSSSSSSLSNFKKKPSLFSHSNSRNNHVSSPLSPSPQNEQEFNTNHALEQRYEGEFTVQEQRYKLKLKSWLRQWEYQVQRGRSGKKEKKKVKKWLYKYNTFLHHQHELNRPPPTTTSTPTPTPPSTSFFLTRW